MTLRLPSRWLWLLSLATLSLATICSNVVAANDIKPLKIAAKAPTIELSDFRGRKWSWDELRGDKVTVVAFLGTECPLVKLYATRLEAMSKELADKGVKLIGVNANQHDSLAEMEHFVRTNKITFPMLKDAGNRLADAYGAQRTPEIFVLDSENSLRYHGRIDDQYTYGLQKPEVTRAHLKESVEQLLAGKSVSIAETKTVGCHIGRLLTPDPESKITYSNQVSRILQKRCVSCHRQGEIAPFALRDYDEVVGWAEMIAEVVSEQRMPPWHADPKHGKFSNDASLTKEEKSTLLAWVEAGAPEGDPKQLPEPITFTEGWQIGKPDLVVKMRTKPFHVPAEGEVKYRHFMVDPDFKEDKWIQAAECRPGNRAVVHHILVMALPPGASPGRRREPSEHGTPSSEWVSATAPGAPPQVMPKGTAKLIKAGSKLIFQLHYTPNGVAQDDLSSIGFIFADPKSVKQEVATRQAANPGFRIPPNTADHPVKSQYKFERDAKILTLFPHMHLRGQAFKYTLLAPGKEPEVLLDVPHYDFNWQTGYRLAEPKFVPAGSVLRCEAKFDNSERNLANPDPSKQVRWGDQTWEEMMIGYFDMVLADQDLTVSANAKSRTDDCLEALKKSAFDPSPFAAKLDVAVESSQTLGKFGKRLQEFMPQLDRMDWSYVDGKQFYLKQVVQSSGPRFGNRPLNLESSGMTLADYAKEGELVVNNRFGRGLGYDMKMFAGHFGSSLHIPFRKEGKAGLISFWSKDENAFPQEVVTALQAVVAGKTAAKE